MDEMQSNTNTKQVITIVGGSSTLTRSMMRLAMQLKLQLLIEEASVQQLERLRADGPEEALLTLGDIPITRSRDWADWDVAQLSPYCSYYEDGNTALVQARRDCLLGLRVRERARRIHQRNVGWVRYSARCGVQHERLRQMSGSEADEPLGNQPAAHYPTSTKI